MVEFANLINAMKPEEALTLGRLHADLPNWLSVTTDARLASAREQAASSDFTRNTVVITRGAKFLHYEPGQPVLLLLDFDEKGIPAEVLARIEAAGGFWPALCSVIPELTGARRVVRGSSSSGITHTNTGKKLPGYNNLHIYLLIADGTDARRFLYDLHSRLWFAGFGWYGVATDGKALDRSLVDKMVGGPERFVIEGPPVLIGRLHQAARTAVCHEGAVVNTRLVCPPLSDAEQAELRRLQAKSRGIAVEPTKPGKGTKSPARALRARVVREERRVSLVEGDYADLNERLKVDPETWVRALLVELGEPKVETTANGVDLRYGNRGSLRVTIVGEWAGISNDYEGDGGRACEPFDFIARRLGGAPEAAAWAIGQIGDATAAPSDQPTESVEEAKAARAEAQERAEALKIARARQLVAQCIPVAGTLGEVYLTKSRKIPKRQWPDTVHYHPRSQCLLFVAKTPDGEVQAVQRVVLTPDGRKATPEEAAARGLPGVKFTNGARNGTCVTLPGPLDGPVQLAEGPETGLSAWAATGHETHIALGGMGNYIPLDGRRTIVCCDRDADHEDATRALHNAAARWVRAGCDIVLATPYDEFKSKDRKDFNDLLRTKGLPAVRRRILEPQRAKVQISQDADTARAAVRAAVQNSRFAHAAVTKVETPPWPGRKPNSLWQALRSTTGTGKTGAARATIVELLRTMRAAGDGRTAIIAVPTLALGREQAERLQDLQSEFSIGLWRGRKADDPRMVGETMCRNLEEVHESHVRHLDVQSTCCWSRKGQCKLYTDCSYQAQRIEQHDIWIVTHPLLFTKRPEAIGEPAFIFIDEKFWHAGLWGIDGYPETLPLATLGSTLSELYRNLDRARRLSEKPSAAALKMQKKFAKKMGRKNEGFVYFDVDKIRILQAKLLRALRDAPGGPVTRQSLIDGGLTWADAHDGYELVWTPKVVPEIYPGMAAAAREKALEEADGNKILGKLRMMWQAVMVLLQEPSATYTPLGDASGWLKLSNDEDGNRVLILKGRRRGQESWYAPRMYLDATLVARLLPFYARTAELIGDINVDAPHQFVRQVVDEAFSKASLTDPEKKKGAKVLGAVHDLAARYAGKTVLCVMQKDVEERYKDQLPANVVTAHHNAIAGRDDWSHVDCLIIVGSTRPPPEAVETLAECLTGWVIPRERRIKGWYDARVVEREMRDGSLVYGVADHHPHPIAEAIRAQICESEILQILGRPRGINRKAKNPVDIYLLTDAPVPVPLDKVITWGDLAPGPKEQMLAAGSLAFESPKDAAAAYPALWKTRKAAASAFDRGDWPNRVAIKTNHSRGLAIAGTQTLIRRDSFIGIASQLKLTPWIYSRIGKGQRPVRVWSRRGAFPDAKTVKVALEVSGC